MAESCSRFASVLPNIFTRIIEDKYEKKNKDGKGHNVSPSGEFIQVFTTANRKN